MNVPLPEDLRSLEGVGLTPVQLALATYWSYEDLSHVETDIANRHISVDEAAQDAASRHDVQEVVDVLRVMRLRGVDIDHYDSPGYPIAASLLVNALVGLRDDGLRLWQRQIAHGLLASDRLVQMVYRAALHRNALAKMIATTVPLIEE